VPQGHLRVEELGGSSLSCPLIDGVGHFRVERSDQFTWSICVVNLVDTSLRGLLLVFDSRKPPEHGAWQIQSAKGKPVRN